MHRKMEVIEFLFKDLRRAVDQRIDLLAKQIELVISEKVDQKKSPASRRRSRPSACRARRRTSHRRRRRQPARLVGATRETAGGRSWPLVRRRGSRSGDVR